MLTAWLSETGVLLDDTGVLLCADCPCGPETGGCTHCPDGVLAKFWSLTVSGITDGTGANCANANGTFTIQLLTNPSNCRAVSTTSFTIPNGEQCLSLPAPQPVTGVWSFYHESNGYWYVLLQAATLGLIVAAYRLIDTSFDCLGPNTLSLYAPDTKTCCATYPSTITITPI